MRMPHSVCISLPSELNLLKKHMLAPIVINDVCETYNQNSSRQLLRIFETERIFSDDPQAHLWILSGYSDNYQCSSMFHLHEKFKLDLRTILAKEYVIFTGADRCRNQKKEGKACKLVISKWGKSVFRNNGIIRYVLSITGMQRMDAGTSLYLARHRVYILNVAFSEVKPTAYLIISR